MKTSSQKNLKFLFLLVPLLGAMTISGCTTGTSGPTFGNGMVVLNWEPTFSSVESGDNLQLRVRVQNKGGTEALGVKAILTEISAKDWGITAVSGMTEEKLFGDMLPPNPTQNTDGAIKEAYFDAYAPALPEGVTQSYSPSVRVTYGYVTSAVKQMTLVNEQELRRLQDQGKTLPTGDIQTTAGPLKVTVNTGKFIKQRDVTAQPYGTSVASNIFPVTIVIENTGGGVVSPLGRNDISFSGIITGFGALSGLTESDYLVYAMIEPPEGISIDSNCLEPNYIYGSGTRSLTGGTIDGYVKLWKGQTASITCEMEIDDTLAASKNVNMKIYLAYYYYIDSTTTVTVTGIR